MRIVVDLCSKWAYWRRKKSGGIPPKIKSPLLGAAVEEVVVEGVHLESPPVISNVIGEIGAGHPTGLTEINEGIKVGLQIGPTEIDLIEVGQIEIDQIEIGTDLIETEKDLTEIDLTEIDLTEIDLIEIGLIEDQGQDRGIEKIVAAEAGVASEGRGDSYFFNL